MRVVAIVQARLGSSRLPLKSLLALKGKPVMDWVLERLAKSARLDGIVAAIPDTALDTVLANHTAQKGFDCIRGPENDVLARFTMAADCARADWVVRVCADNPLVSWEAIDSLIDFYAGKKCDYAWNHIPRNNEWPDGLGAEIVSVDLLHQIDKMANLPAQREHCLNYLWDNASAFRMDTFNPAQAWLRHPEIRLDIDCTEDFARLSLLPIAPEQNLETLMANLLAANSWTDVFP